MSNETKKCPFCAEEIRIDARKCRYCGEMQNEEDESENNTLAKAKELAADTVKAGRESAQKALQKADNLYNKLPLDNINKKLEKLPIRIDVKSPKFKVLLLCFLVTLLGFFAWHFCSTSIADGLVKEAVADILEEQHPNWKKVECTRVTNIESCGKNLYTATAIIQRNKDKGVVDINYEVIDSTTVRVWLDLDSLMWFKWKVILP